jgi:sulfatase maturation enzyme AslB (radical SAM superfamily)
MEGWLNSLISVTLAPGWRCEKTGSLAEALTVFLPAMLSKEPGGRELQEERNRCPLLKFCDICPSAAYLETGSLDGHVDYLCQVAHARSANRIGTDGNDLA